MSDEFLSLLTTDQEITSDDLSELVAPTTPADNIRVLHDVVQGLRQSSPVIEGVRPLSRAESDVVPPAPDGMTGDIAVVSVRTRIGIRGNVYFTTRPDRSLGGLRMSVEEPPVHTAGELRDQLRRLDPTAAVAVRTPSEDAEDIHPKAVSSLVKVFVLEAVLRAVDQGDMRLDDESTITSGDISLLSPGLTAEHVGSRITTAELCRLMILRSDNTATDMLMGMAGTEAVLQVMNDCGADADLNRPLSSMRETIEAAWIRGRPGDPPDSAHRGDGSSIAQRRPAHQDGFDYFVPLGAVGRAFELVARHEWSPWSPTGVPDDRAVYKGGSAPGVLSATWYREFNRAPAWVCFAINTDEPLGALEELFAFACAEGLLVALGISDHATGTVHSKEMAR